LARSFGADTFIGYDRENVVEAVKAASPGGTDAVLDLVDGDDAIGAMADVIKNGGRIVSTIGAADIDAFARRGITAQNIVVGQTPSWSHAGLRTLLELVEQGRLRVTIAAERDLSDAVGALEESKRGRVNGKLVITVD